MILSLDENNVIGGDTVCDKMRQRNKKLLAQNSKMVNFTLVCFTKLTIEVKVGQGGVVCSLST